MTIIILAAGLARRMGRQKLLLPIDGMPMIARVIDAAAGYRTVIVAGAELVTVLRDAPVRVIRNDAPERGMNHSLALADAAIEPDEPVAILLGDVPDITPAWIARTIAAYDRNVDVVVPRAGDRFAHPVVFGPAARRLIAALPDGDSLKTIRDEPNLRRRIVEGEPVSGPLFDIDTPADYAERARGLLPPVL